jgi:hypothetical protein
MHNSNPDLYRYIFTALIIGIVLALRLRRVGQMRKMRLETLWIVPAIFFAIAGIMFFEAPPHGLGWLWCAIALAAGAAIGWQRGRFVEIHVDPDTHELNQKASAGAIIFIVVLMGVRYGLRYVMEMGEARWHLNALLISGIFISLALGMLSSFRLEMYLRARRLLAAARALKA